MSEDDQPAKQPRLLPLTPEYRAEDHSVYLDAVEAALTGDDAGSIRNIALTGSYGTGKSSVLQQVPKKHKKKVLQVSLSTLGIEEAEADSVAQSKTNRIQKEIVKQFLYSEDPAKAPGSRFRRIGRLKFLRELATALLVGPVVALIFLLAGWSDKLIDLAKTHVSSSVESNLPLITFAILWVIASGFTLAIRYLTHNRIRIEKVTAGPATISLADDSTSFFDRYLDEIVYFFDVTKYDIVIFEDVDRFDDPNIFETLRALNTLLNGARQLQGRSIRFIYAIKDSIFDELGLRAARNEGADRHDTDIARADAADAELARANRTKFFDLVIPVVPFITHQSARDLMFRVMGEIENKVSSDLIDLAARHLADMRFIKNVRNEFVIFRQRVLPTSGEGLVLSEDSLFAMMLYKGTHLSDFEAMRLGTSKLDLLYKASRDLVRENVARLDTEARHIRRRLARLDSVESRSGQLGAELADYLERSAQQIRVQRHEAHSISFCGQSMTAQDLQTVDFWKRFVADEGPVTITVPGFQPPGWGNILSVEVDVSRATAAQALGDPLSLHEWQAEDRSDLPRRLTEIQNERDFLLQADMGDLINRPDLTVSQRDEESRIEEQTLSLAALSEKHLGSVLARQLVAAGYIDRDFTLYGSTYYDERVSTRARNFLMHNIDPNVADVHFVLDHTDVDTVLRERGELVLHERGSYNIAILDHLLGNEDSRVDLLVGALCALGEPEREFLQAYITTGQHGAALAGKMSARSTRTFLYLVAEVEVEEAMRAHLIGAALLTINPKLTYETGAHVKEYFEANYPSLAPITDKKTSKQAAAQITTLLVSMDARLQSLRPLGPQVLNAVVVESRYVISRDNLLAAMGDDASLALDAIKKCNRTVYAYLLENHAAYITTLNDDETTIEANSAFVKTVEDIVEHATGLLPAAVQRAAKECVLTDVTEVTQEAWPTLALDGRFPATFANVTVYITEVGSLDENLASLLIKSKAILEVPDDDENSKHVLAKHVLSSVIELPSPRLRIELVASLDLDTFMPTTAIPSESGQLVGLLLKERIIEDDAASFTLALRQDWPTREYAISQSEEFQNYMTPTEVPVDDLAPLFRSNAVPTRVKQKIVANVAEYTVEADRVALEAVAEYALSNNLQLPLAEIARHASERVPARLVIGMLQTHLTMIGLDELAPILRDLGEPYRTISERNGKRPKLPNTRADIALVQRLKELDVVSTYDANLELIVNMKKPTD